MLIAGDPLAHQGPYRDTLDVLSSGLLEKHGFTHLGVAAHPDGHAHASESDVRSALEIKKAYAREKDVHMWVVTQFVFDMTNFAKWLDDWEEAFDFLPIHVGLAGPSSLAILMRYAARCGVATSVKMLLTNRNSRRLMSSWNPDDQLKELYELCGNHVSRRLKGLHLFPFGGLESAARWLEQMAGKGIGGNMSFRPENKASESGRNDQLPTGTPDIEIARSVAPQSILLLAQQRLGLPAESLIPFGHFKAKVDPSKYRHGSGHQATDPVFIVGSQRAGSSQK